MIDLENLTQLAQIAEPSSNAFYKKNKKRLETMDMIVHDLHHRISEKTDCLNCANCCRTLGPRITDKDIDRIAKTLKMKPSEFFQVYLRKDEDGDSVFKTMPCPFIMTDNYCKIYEVRPKACREYPHTNRKKFYQIFRLSVKNASVCPIVYEVLEELKNKSIYHL